MTDTPSRDFQTRMTEMLVRSTLMPKAGWTRYVYNKDSQALEKAKPEGNILHILPLTPTSPLKTCINKTPDNLCDTPPHLQHSELDEFKCPRCKQKSKGIVRIYSNDWPAHNLCFDCADAIATECIQRGIWYSRVIIRDANGRYPTDAWATPRKTDDHCGGSEDK